MKCDKSLLEGRHKVSGVLGRKIYSNYFTVIFWVQKKKICLKLKGHHRDGAGFSKPAHKFFLETLIYLKQSCNSWKNILTVVR